MRGRDDGDGVRGLMRVTVSLTLMRLVRQAKHPGEGLPVFTIVIDSHEASGSPCIADQLERVVNESELIDPLGLDPWVCGVDHDAPVVGSSGTNPIT